MWVGDKWHLLHRDLIPLINAVIPEHDLLKKLESGGWTILGKDYYQFECVVRHEVLQPFLFGKPYGQLIFNTWIKSCGLNLGKDVTDNIEAHMCVELFDTVAVQISQILYFLRMLGEECGKLMELLFAYQSVTQLLLIENLEDALSLLESDHLYNIVEKFFKISIVHTSKLWSTAYCISMCTAINIVLENHFHSIFIELSSLQLAEKNFGNVEFKAGHFKSAITSYTKIINENPYNNTVYSNRSQTYIRLEKWVEAEIDARRAIIIDPTWCKAYSKLAVSLDEQGRIHQAHIAALEGWKKCKVSKSCTFCPELLKTFATLNSKCLKIGMCSKKTVVPDLKSDAELLTLDSKENHEMPELMSDSGSDSQNDEAPRKIVKTSVVSRKTIQKNLQIEKISAGDLLKSLKIKIQQGSECLLQKDEVNAVKNFEVSLDILKQHDKFVDDKDVFIIKYALGMAYAAGDLDNLHKALIHFEGMQKEGCKEFPALLYAIGFVLFKLFRFDEALNSLCQALNLSNKNNVLKQYCWPETDLVIEETIKEKLQAKLQDLITKCRYAPKPDGTCRLPSCAFTRNISYSDPNFKGCYQLFCTGNCRIDFHSQCWKLIRDDEGKTEKDFLDNTCITPDCGQSIYTIQIISKRGAVQNSFESSTHAKNKMVKHRKTKLQKKSENRTNKKLKKIEKGKKTSKDEELENDDNEDDKLQEEVNDVDTLSNGITQSNSVTENIPANTSPFIYEFDSEPTYIFKKEESVPNNDVEHKPIKVREKKNKGKKNIICVDEFCKDVIVDGATNEYLERVQRLQETKKLMEDCDSISSCDDCVPNNLDMESQDQVCRSVVDLKDLRSKVQSSILSDCEPVEQLKVSGFQNQNLSIEEHAFQLQVTLLALPEDFQLNMVAGIINNFASREPEFWQKLNEITDYKLTIGLKDKSSAEKIKTLKNQSEKLLNSNEELVEVIHKLDEDLKNLRANNVKLHESHFNTKSGLERDIQHWQTKFNDKIQQQVDLCGVYEAEIQSLKNEKMALQDEVKSCEKESENVRNLKEKFENVEKELGLCQSELDTVRIMTKSQDDLNKALFAQLENMDLKMNKTMEYLIREREKYGDFIMKTAVSRACEILGKTSKQLEIIPKSTGVEYENLKVLKLMQTEHLNKLISTHSEFLINIEKCVRSFKTNEDIFTFDEIPSVPNVAAASESLPPGFLFPHASTSSNLIKPNLGAGIANNLPPALLPTPSIFKSQPNMQLPLNFKGSATNFTQPRANSVPVALFTNMRENVEDTSNSYYQTTPITSTIHQELFTSDKARAIPHMIPPTTFKSPAKEKSCYDKIIHNMKLRCPELCKEEINNYIKRFRTEREKLTGKTTDQIVQLLCQFIAEDKSHSSQKVDIKKPKSILRDLSQATDASKNPFETSTSKVWKVNPLTNKTFDSNDCTICMESLSIELVFNADCGHSFHEKCVRSWIASNSNCPLCRTYLLLPEDFPKL